MGNSTILMLYLLRQFLQWIMIVALVLASITMLFDYVELTRRFAGRDHVDNSILFAMTIYKLPDILQQITPFAILFSAMIMLHRNAMNNEIVAMRAAGFSIWQLLFPFVGIAFLFSIIDITIINPFSAFLRGQYEHHESQLLNRNRGNIIINKSGVWLRQSNQQHDLIIHAKNLSNQGRMLDKPTFYRLKKDQSLVSRVDGDYSELFDGYWLVSNARTSLNNGQVTWENQKKIATDLNHHHMISSLSSPSTISFWLLPDFIQKLKDTGVDVKAYEVKLFAIFASPILNLSMVIFACVFVARNLKRRSAFKSFAYGIMLTFALYFTMRFTQTLGVTGILPAAMSVFVPSCIALLAAFWSVLHFEETAS